MLFIQRSLSIIVIVITAFNPALASQNPGAHVHGQALLQVALEGERIEVVFETPAANLVGFEYKPGTDAERKLVAEVRQWLKSTPLVNTAASTCRVEHASVSTTLDQDTHYKHGHDEHEGEHGHDEDADSHSEFEVSQQLVCNVAPGENLVTPLLSRYPSINTLNIDWVTANAQGSTRLETGGTGFRLTR